ncbi:MAG: NUDIX domain-containing protein [Bacteroidetes bacterium]|nr:NUDIX domain-containing protein [Bacteroidota bacterium]
MPPIIIFFENTPVYLVQDITTFQALPHDEATLSITQFTNNWLHDFLQNQGWKNYRKVIVSGKDISNLKKDFFGNFKIIKAGGGIVLNEKGELLLIFRNGKWDLPKGKLEKGEQIEDCAIREVQEETGIATIKLIKPAGTTYHTYFQHEDWILKESTWFQMSTQSTENLLPQIEEGITEIKWTPLAEMKFYKENMYPALIPLVDELD